MIKIAVIYNRESKKVINLFGLPNREKYGLVAIKRIVTALKHYGTKSLAEVLAPAVLLAHQGFRVSPLQHFLTKRELKHLRVHSAGKIFLKKGKTPYPIGSILKQSVLADPRRDGSAGGP